MKTVTMVSALALIISTQAYAADLNGGYKGSTPPVLANETSWTGFYLGGNVGAGWSQLDSSFNGLAEGNISYFGYDNPLAYTTNAGTDIVGGGQIGYNFQTGALLLGVEADFGYFGISQEAHWMSATGGNTGSKMEGGFLADVTGRLGYVSGPALFYIKGGWAYLDGTASFNEVTKTSAKSVGTSGFDGWTIGGGLEYMLNSSWSIKAEYQHFDFGEFSLLPDPKNVKTVIDNDLTVDAVKVGLNYHFNNSYASLK